MQVRSEAALLTLLENLRETVTRPGNPGTTVQIVYFQGCVVPPSHFSHDNYAACDSYIVLDDSSKNFDVFLRAVKSLVAEF